MAKSLIHDRIETLFTWTSFVSMLGKTPDELHLLHPQLDKRGYKVTDRFARKTIPVKPIAKLTVPANLSKLQDVTDFIESN